MAIVIDADLLKTLTEAVKATYQNAFNSTETLTDRLATVVPSNTKTNTYAWLGDMPELREWIGERLVKDIAVHGYSIVNKTFESTIGISRDDVEDDQYGIYKPRFEMLGQKAKRHPEKLLFELLKKGEAEACYDGQAFFANNHPVFQSHDGTGTFDQVANVTTGTDTGVASWYLLDLSQPLKPLIHQTRRDYGMTAMDNLDDERVFMNNEFRYGVDGRGNVGFGFWQMAHLAKSTALTPENFNKVYDAMTAIKGDGGKPLGITPTVLLVPTSLRVQAQEIVKDRLTDGSDNVNAGLVDVIVTPHLN